MNKKFKYIICVVTIAILVFGYFGTVFVKNLQTSVLNLQRKEDAISREKELLKESELFAKSAVLMDGSSGRVLYGKNQEQPLANASTTKILTAILALESGKENEVFTASDQVVSAPKVKLGIQKDEKFYLKDLLYSLMLESHNDSAVMIAQGVSGSVEKFAKLMNEKAKTIGCKDSYFITPNGLDAVDEKGKHHTTATDLALIMRYCVCESVQKERFMEICQTQMYQFCDVAQSRTFSCHNHNALLTQIDGVMAGKTGFTGDAGYCYVAALKKDERIYIVSLLACGWPNNKGYKWKDCRKLFDLGIKEYQLCNVDITSVKKIPQIIIYNGKNRDYFFEENGCMTPKMKIKKLQMLMASWEKVKVEYDLPHTVEAPVDKNHLAGYCNVYINDKIYFQQAMIYPNQIAKRSMDWYFLGIIKKWML